MLRSMTGFGRAELTVGVKTYLVEIRTLNGKQLEMQLKLPPILKPYEFDIRSILQEKLIRGSVECYVNVKQNGSAKSVVLNTELIRSYYEQIRTLAEELKVDTDAAFASLLRLPDVVTPTNEMMSEEDFEDFKKVLNEALETLNEHRKSEGVSLSGDLEVRINNIHLLEKKILELEPNRMDRIKQEINTRLENFVGIENIDANRKEQELIYYMEKIDIHEEQIRLRQHCSYFEEILNNDDEGKGKKLSFILQEIGREINTTGSKAYDAEIQKCVVEMKDELEKAKEQVLNVL